MGAMNRVGMGLSYRSARLHRLVESIPGRLKSLRIPSLDFAPQKICMYVHSENSFPNLSQKIGRWKTYGDENTQSEMNGQNMMQRVNLMTKYPRKQNRIYIKSRPLVLDFLLVKFQKFLRHFR
jgi:hypothetical protein